MKKKHEEGAIQKRNGPAEDWTRAAKEGTGVGERAVKEEIREAAETAKTIPATIAAMTTTAAATTTTTTTTIIITGTGEETEYEDLNTAMP